MSGTASSGMSFRRYMVRRNIHPRSSAYGGGTGGASFSGCSPQPSVSTTSGNGSTGVFPGGGGNGGVVGGAGGLGASGMVIAEWFA
jgi:hypothetical protein